jgi:hypothetical protein
MIRYGHPTRGVVDYGPANGRGGSGGFSGPGHLRRHIRPMKTGASVATPIMHVPHDPVECCGVRTLQSFPCPVCGQPVWSQASRVQFHYVSED